ncbi:MAG: EAL domain-containing protein [Verrucomicrobiae bacterium]
MAFPALQNRTSRIIILALATVGAVAAITGAATLSYRQTRSAAIASMENTTAAWTDATARLMSGARAKLERVDQVTKGAVSPQTSATLRRLVLDSTNYREAWLVQDGQVVCTDLGIMEPPLPLGPDLCELAAAGDVRLLFRNGVGDLADAIVLNFNTGKNYFWAVSIPTRSLGEAMRYGDRNSDHAVFLLRPDGVLLDHSLNARNITNPPARPPGSGLSETESDLIYARRVPGYNYSVVAILPKPVLWALWGRTLPLYAGLALALAVCFFLTAWIVNARTLSLEAELREAARLRQIVAHYQPILNLQTGHCVGVEVLMRWQHPIRGLVPPLAFIPEAERTGVITELTECMMIRAFEELAPVFQKHPHLHAAINIPIQTLVNPSFLTHVNLLIKGRYAYENISFELTESSSLTEAALGQLGAMKALGIRLAVDDFGTGYSNMRYLSLFPFDFLKVDKAFVDGISADGKSSGLVDQIVSIGRACHMEIIAEGIEQKTQADYLRRLGVEFGQGYFFAAPMTRVELQVWLEQPGRLAPEAAQAESLLPG